MAVRLTCGEPKENPVPEIRLRLEDKGWGIWLCAKNTQTGADQVIMHFDNDGTFKRVLHTDVGLQRKQSLIVELP